MLILYKPQQNETYYYWVHVQPPYDSNIYSYYSVLLLVPNKDSYGVVPFGITMYYLLKTFPNMEQSKNMV